MKTLLIILIFLPAVVFSQLDIDLELFASGYSQPTEIVNAGDDRLFVVEKSGRIKILYTDGTQETTPFLNITSRVTSGGERGLLGLAFPPDYSTNGEFYVNYTYEIEYEQEDSLFTRISRFTVDPDDANLADSDSEEILLEYYQPFSNHNGGQLEFGPDGYLYIASGDGGSGGDPDNYGQNKMTFLGKLLRIDVSSTSYNIPSDNPFVGDSSGFDEIWAYGLRNPWKFAFDGETGDLYIGDVGQSAWEEVDFQPAGAPGGANYGWRCYEGTQNYQSPQCPDSIVVTDPIFEYSHDDGCSITGGRVYRGSAYPNFVGKYILADFCSGNYWLLWQENGEWQSIAGGTLDSQIAAFGEDLDGEMYAIRTYAGEVHKVISVVEEVSITASVTWPSSCGERSAVFELYQPQTDVLEYQYDVTIDEMGQFQITGVPVGSFDVFLKVDGYLKKTIGTQSLTENIEFSFFSITSGDLNGDNAVNISDLSILNVSFGKSAGDEGYNILADLNCNGLVNILDFSLLGASFGLGGDNAPFE